MNIFKTSKVIERINQMIDNAMEGKPVENGFDESKMSALETKMATFLAMNSSTKIQLEEEKNRINSLISDISHQTKTPLANILIYSQLLQESNLSQTDKDCLDALTQQTEKLNFLIGSLVKTSRLEAGIITVNAKNQPLRYMLNNAVLQAQQSAKSKNITLNFEGTSLSASFDLKWATEAIYNIIDNALKYTHAGGSVSIKVIAYELFVRIDICDTGIGISEDEIAQIFTRFYRSPLVSDIVGVGIGLYLAREIISLQGGYIKVTSKPKEGSTFSIFLPKE